MALAEPHRGAAVELTCAFGLPEADRERVVGELFGEYLREQGGDLRRVVGVG